jgi:DNA-binding CsgD family transcriptional regulator
MSLALEPLLDLLYEAPLHEGGWGAFAQSLQKSMRSTDCALVSYSSLAAPPAVSEYSGDPATAELYERHYGAVNPWLRPISQLGLGTVATDEELLPMDRFRSTEFYNDFGRRHAVVHTAGVVLHRGPGQLAFISLDRGEQAGPFPADQVQLLHRLTPHLQRAVRIQTALAEKAPAPSPDEIQFVLDCAGRVLQCTAAAEQLLRLGDIALRANRELDLTRLCPFPLGPAISAGVPVEKQFPALPFRPQVSLRPTPTRNPFGQRAAFALSVRFAVSTPALEWRMTAAEFRLAEQLRGGSNLRQSAVALGISYNTAKTQLAAIYSKSNCRSQSQLVSALLG